MRLIVLASGEFARPTLRWLAQSDHEVVTVVTQPARKSGRGQKMARTPAAALAEELGIETIAPADVNAPEMVARLASQGARLGLAIAFGQKFGPALLAAFPEGCINLHASMLPKYRGAAPINWAVVNGEQRTGCTVFRMVARMDAGPVLASRWTEIKPEETAGELHDRLAGIGVDAVNAALRSLEQDPVPAGTPQDESQATRAPKISKIDGLIRFYRPARAVANHICGMTPWPGAQTRYASKEGRWENVAITRARPAEDPAPPGAPPGSIDARRYVAAADRYLELLEIKPSSGRNMAWAEYVNGRHVAVGDMFVSLEA